MKLFDLNTKPKIKTGFQAPPAYFETFESKLFNQLKLEEEPVVISVNSRKTNWYYAIAALVILAISIPVYQNWKFNSTVSPSAEELEYYVNNHPNFTANEIISQLSDEDIQAMQLTSNLQTENIENYLLQTESIEYYLID